MKNLLLIITMLVLTCTTASAQTTEQLASMSRLKIELPSVQEQDLGSLLSKSSTINIFAGKDDTFEKPKYERNKSKYITAYKTINPKHITEASVSVMFDKYWNYFYHQSLDPYNNLDNFHVGKNHLELVYFKKVQEVNLAFSKEISTLFLNRVLYEMHNAGLKKVNFMVLSPNEQGGKIFYKPLVLSDTTYIDPYITYEEWVKSGFLMFEKNAKLPPRIIEITDDAEIEEEVEIDLGDF